MPVRDRQIKYDGPNYPDPNPDLLRYKTPREWPPLYNTDDVEKRTVEPQQSATDGKDTRRTPFREEENICSYCGWGGVRQDPKEIAHYCEDCGTIMPGHTLEENVGNRHETVGEGFGQDAAFPDSDKNGAMHTLIKTENNVRTSKYHADIYKLFNAGVKKRYSRKQINAMQNNSVRNVIVSVAGMEEFDNLMVKHTGQAFNSGKSDDWQKPKLQDLDPYKLFERNLVNRTDRNPNPDNTAPLEGAGFGLLYGNPRKDKVWVGDNPSETTDRSKYLREHMEGL